MSKNEGINLELTSNTVKQRITDNVESPILLSMVSHDVLPPIKPTLQIIADSNLDRKPISDLESPILFKGVANKGGDDSNRRKVVISTQYDEQDVV